MSLRWRCVKDYLSKITKAGIATKKNFWKTIKPFLTDNSDLENPRIMLQGKGKTVLDELV